MLRRSESFLGGSNAGRPRYLEPVVPVVFPEEADVPETQLHLDLRTLLYQLLSDYLGAYFTVGSDQFVYFDASDPGQSLAPDVLVRATPRGAPIRSWKTWERGAPDVAVEIASENDSGDVEWQRKLSRYRRVGVRELIRFDPEAAPGQRLGVWDRIDGALTQREVLGDAAPSSVLDVHWVTAAADGHEIALRIASPEPAQLIPTRLEAREVAERRIVELEAELRRRS